jgi:hypothetical protein
MKREHSMFRRLNRCVAWLSVLVSIFVFPTAGLAHDSWISRNALRNTTGEWCCGEGDCPALNYTPRVTSGGYQLENGELVPFSEVQPSPDGTFVRCHRPDGTRRCFFAPPNNS